MQKTIKQILQSLLLIFGIALTIYHAITYFNTNAFSSLLLAGQMLLGIIIIFVPTYIRVIFKIELPLNISILYWIFILFAVFIGTGCSIYEKVFFWDKLLHLSSAMLLTSIGLSLIGFFLRDTSKANINPLFFCFFSFFFAVAIGVFWEFHEFTFDHLLGMNMQRYKEISGPLKVGQPVLYDTMSDFLFNVIGALIFAIYSYFKIKQQPLWLENISIKSIKK